MTIPIAKDAKPRRAHERVRERNRRRNDDPLPDKQEVDLPLSRAADRLRIPQTYGALVEPSGRSWRQPYASPTLGATAKCLQLTAFGCQQLRRRARGKPQEPAMLSNSSASGATNPKREPLVHCLGPVSAKAGA